MVETPRATLTADRLVEHAELFSVGSNDLTQTTYALSRDDAETTFLVDYPRMHLFDQNPFISLHGEGVGKLIDMAIASARARPDGFEVAVCGEHGGDPTSITWCHEHALTYVSCSPFRLTVARLAAAQAALAESD